MGALRITYNDRKSSFEKLLRKGITVSIHHRNLQDLATEILKIKNNMTSEILNEIFQKRTLSHNLRKDSSFYVWQVHSVYHRTESQSFLGPKIWELVPENIKQSESLETFKNKIKNWVPLRCPCRLCSIYHRFHETKLSFSNIIYIFLTFHLTYYYFLIIITVCSEILFGVVLWYSETSQFRGVSEQTKVFTISIYYLIMY